ncbi:unnamed protein product [Lampetra fluviatilis]
MFAPPPGRAAPPAAKRALHLSRRPRRVVQPPALPACPALPVRVTSVEGASNKMSGAGKRVLIVFAHQEPLRSFNGALKEAAVQALSKQGCQVEVSDLYASTFNPVATRADILGDLKSTESFRYGEETAAAWEKGKLSQDIVNEQKKVQDADLVIFQFPLYWFSMPAIMKGWMDRVLTRGFAYGFPQFYESGPFTKKKALISITTGGMESMYGPTGVNGDINVILWPMQQGMLHFCGFQVLAPQISWSPSFMPEEGRKGLVAMWEQRLASVWQEKTLKFAPLELFDPKKGFVLNDDTVKNLSTKPQGLTVGQHAGKPLPPNNQTKANDASAE